MGWERIGPSFLTQIRYRFLIPPRYKDSCLISSFVQSRGYLAWFFQKTQNYYWNRSNQGKIGDTVKSDFGSDGFGKNCIYYVIPHAIRVPKKYILSMLEISRVITIPIPLCRGTSRLFSKEPLPLFSLWHEIVRNELMKTYTPAGKSRHLWPFIGIKRPFSIGRGI